MSEEKSEEKWDVVKEGTHEETVDVRPESSTTWTPPLFGTNRSGKYRFTLTYKVEQLDEQADE